MATYTLVCPLLDGDPKYAYGVEFGMIWARLTRGGEDEIDDYFTLENQEQILLAANRLGWKVKRIKPWGERWFRVRMARPG